MSDRGPAVPRLTPVYTAATAQARVEAQATLSLLTWLRERRQLMDARTLREGFARAWEDHQRNMVSDSGYWRPPFREPPPYERASVAPPVADHIALGHQRWWSDWRHGGTDEEAYHFALPLATLPFVPPWDMDLL